MQSEDIDNYEQEEVDDTEETDDVDEPEEQEEEGDASGLPVVDGDVDGDFGMEDDDDDAADPYMDTDMVNEPEGAASSSFVSNNKNKEIESNEIFVDEGNYEKFDNEIRLKYLKEYHPECIHNNYDEMLKKTFIKRDEDGLISDDENHRTIPFLTKYEKTKIIGLRIKQLNTGARPFIDLKDIFKRDLVLDNYLIAEKELEEKKLPFIISRPINNKNIEYWNLKDLELIH